MILLCVNHTIFIHLDTLCSNQNNTIQTSHLIRIIYILLETGMYDFMMYESYCSYSF
jgi:hypothetical protein